MFIDRGTKGIFGSSSGAKCLPGVTHPQEHFAPLELGAISLGLTYYKHYIPTGLGLRII